MVTDYHIKVNRNSLIDKLLGTVEKTIIFELGDIVETNFKVNSK
jgi:hypothetical protein